MSEIENDRRARREALDPMRSFIVQAPAGSGKTELLIQRYLTLLARVERPEQIVAITFTRKAAAEMRNRIAAALAEARSDAEVAPHRRTTLALARKVLERDREYGWDLLTAPQRMRIDTLDALNVWLARQLPLLSAGVAGANVADDCTPNYRRAAGRTVEQLAGQGAVADGLKTLLGILDNSVTRLESMLAALLPKRDQWLRHLAELSEHAFEKELEAALRRQIDDELDTGLSRVPRQWLTALLPLGKHAAAYAEKTDERELLAAFAETTEVPEPRAEELPLWRAIACLVLTRTGGWRRRFDKNLGFRPQDRRQKAELAELLEAVAGDDFLRTALARTGKLPEPKYSEIQCEDLAALRSVLMHLLAELRVDFAETATVDFIEIAMGAQRALGRVDRPSELLLALDRRIQHLLIDEFQDTSQSQMRLIELLTAGWQAGDGRSLFLVGDPMQSIYRFRDADMSLFLKTKQKPIGEVQCQPLLLSSNFRTVPGVVDWINRSFAAVFPQTDILAKGAARFYPSHAEREAEPGTAVQLHCVRGDTLQNEHEQVLAVLARERAASPNQRIAILVRSRRHLLGLRERLRALGWPVRAVEIDPLSESQLGQDLIGLARALSHLGDRIAWLGLLRAPYCGLTWKDLEALAGTAADSTIWELMNDDERLNRVSEDARQRIGFVRGVLRAAFEAFASMSYSDWVERTWRALNADACLQSAGDAALAQQFFDWLGTLTADEDIEDTARFETLFDKPQAQVEAPAPSAIEIMTLHRAKGLEFDTVIMLGLARRPNQDSTRALYWMERVNSSGGSDLLIAPLPREGDRLVSYMKLLDKEQQDAELVRLFYVGATRARDRLHLIAQLKPEQETPPDGSLLSCIWPARKDDFIAAEVASIAAEPMADEFEADLFRRCGEAEDRELWRAPLSDPLQLSVDARPEFLWAGSAAAHIGTVVHAQLQHIAETGIESRSPAEIDRQAESFKRELALLGVEPEELGRAVERVVDALRKVLTDKTGRWLLASRPEAASELRLSIRGGAGIEHAQLDRTFVEDGVRWIVDYKTSAHEGGDIEAFLDSEVTRYRGQLERYARYYTELDDRPIRVGLYFPLLRAFRDWEPDLDRA